jgi:hypothetical protein
LPVVNGEWLIFAPTPSTRLMSQLLTYAKVFSEEEATVYTELLQSAGIPFEVEHARNVLDKIYIGDELDPMIYINIEGEHFEQVNAILKAQAKLNVDKVDPDYYLFDFSDDELINILQQPADWSPFDQGLAEKLLSDRGKDIHAPAIAKATAAEFTPIKLTPIYLVLQYLATVFILYAGVVIGLATLYAYQTLSTGKRVRIYDEPTRLHGKWMIGIGVAIILYIVVFSQPFWFSFL